MINKSCIAVVSALFTLGMAQPVLSEQAAGMDFSSLDQDQDGYISEQEAQSSNALLEVWAASDTNQDGQLDTVEFSAIEIAEPAATGEAPAQ